MEFCGEANQLSSRSKLNRRVEELRQNGGRGRPRRRGGGRMTFGGGGGGVGWLRDGSFGRKRHGLIFGRQWDGEVRMELCTQASVVRVSQVSGVLR